MAIAHVSNGTAGTGTTNTLTPAHPASLAAGDLELEGVCVKYATRTIGTVAGWTARGVDSGGAGTDGTSDEGQVKVAAFSIIAAGGESGTINQTMTGGTANAGLARIMRFTRSAGTGWLFGTATAQLNAGGTTAVSFTFGSDPGLQTGDLAVVIAGFNTDTYSYATHGMTGAGATYSAGTEIMDSGITDGADLRLLVVPFTVSGTSSGAPTFTTTASGSATNAPAGAAVLVRLREDGASGTVLPLIMNAYRQRRSA